MKLAYIILDFKDVEQINTLIKGKSETTIKVLDKYLCGNTSQFFKKTLKT
jgi:hypothetical protein